MVLHERKDLSILERDNLVLGPARGRLLGIGLALAVVGFGASLLLSRGEGGTPRLLHAYLLNYAYMLSIALGALWFVPLQYVTRSSWSVVVRRLAENISATLPLWGVLAIPLLLGLPHLYPWAGPEAAHDHLLAHKAGFLSLRWFTVRLAVYFTVWSVIALLLRRWSLRQDEDGDIAHTLRAEKLGGPALVIYGLTVTLAAFDLLMSLDPHWYSTIFGVYYFAGILVAFFAVMTILTYALQGSGRLVHVVSLEHFNDYGRAMFAFVFFWAYIAFSQYMLIWYANIPEETVWFLRRQEHGWSLFGYLLIFGHWLLPFAGLMSRFTKRKRKLMVFWAAWLLAAHWLDLFWLVMPQASPARAGLRPVDVTMLLGMAGTMIAAVAWTSGQRSLVPRRDPRLIYSLNFENY